MEKINSIEELKQLSHGERFYVINNGEIEVYIFCSINPKVNNSIVAISSNNYSVAKVFVELDFKYGKNVFLKGVYSTEEVGLIMVSQLKYRIGSIEDIHNLTVQS